MCQANAFLMSLKYNLMWLFLLVFSKLLRSWTERTGCCRADIWLPGAKPRRGWYNTVPCARASCTVLRGNWCLGWDLQPLLRASKSLRRKRSPQSWVSTELRYFAQTFRETFLSIWVHRLLPSPGDRTKHRQYLIYFITWKDRDWQILLSWNIQTARERKRGLVYCQSSLCLTKRIHNSISQWSHLIP